MDETPLETSALAEEEQSREGEVDPLEVERYLLREVEQIAAALLPHTSTKASTRTSNIWAALTALAGLWQAALESAAPTQTNDAPSPSESSPPDSQTAQLDWSECPDTAPPQKTGDAHE